MAKRIFLLDRSGADLDDKCGHAYWWNRLEAGIGVVEPGENDALMTGREIHEDLSDIAESPDPLEAARSITSRVLDGLDCDATQAQREHAMRRAGWALAYAIYIEPRVREQYENVHTEGELVLDRGSLWVPTTPDRVLRGWHTGKLVYREYKSTVSASQGYLDSWKLAIQLHIGMKAVEEELGEKVGFAQIMCLMKGDNRDGILKHPYTWGYRNDVTGKWTHEYAKARSAEWNPAPVSEYPGGLEAWVRYLGEDAAREMFPHTEPIFLNERLLEQWITRKRARAEQIEAVKDLCVDDVNARRIYFEQRQGACRPAFGFACPYRLACWNASVYAEPLKHGYVPRHPHHEIEVQWRAEEGL